MPAMTRSLSSCFEATQMWRRTKQISSPEFERGLSIIFRRIHGRSSMVSTPIFVGVADEVGIEVARIAGHFAPEPRRRLDAFGLAGDLHLGDDEPFVVAMEDIDVPGPAAKGFAISGLLDQRTFAQ